MINKLYNKMQDLGLPLNQDRGLEIIQQALQIYNRLLLKQESCRLELDQLDGQEVFREYMQRVESLIKTKAQYNNRQFRSGYTNAYKVLYQDGSLGYIPEIYDSAQEAFPFIYVNGERYDFSSEVLILGERLVESYFKMFHQLRVASLRGQEWAINVKTALEDFDLCWTNYEQKYITELIEIENNSKLAIQIIIHAEENLNNFEAEQKLSGKIFLSGQQYDDLRRKLCEKISKLNSVANLNGKGRDDLTFEILLAAENILCTVTELQSKSVRTLAQKIKESFQNVREVLKFFGQNFQMVDPQLKNNPELVTALQQYECYWEKGKKYFLESKKQNQIVAFSAIVEAAKQKYSAFRELIDFSDPSIFWIIPSLIVLRSLQDEDEGLAQGFLAEAKFSQKLQQYLVLKQHYLDEKRRGQGGFSLYNRLQFLLINQEDKDKIANCTVIVNKIKQMAVSLERVNPMDWNDMLGVLLLDPCE